MSHQPFPPQDLVELLKHPFCVSEARRAVLDALESTYRRPFKDQWEFVEYAQKHQPQLDLFTPPKRPEPKPRQLPTLTAPTGTLHSHNMSFRVLIAGSAHFDDYPALRAALDVLLSNRRPEVVLLTASGRGLPMLAASYAAVHRLEVAVHGADRERFPVDAEERRDLAMVADADAAAGACGGCWSWSDGRVSRFTLSTGRRRAGRCGAEPGGGTQARRATRRTEG